MSIYGDNMFREKSPEEAELASLRQALETSRAETREAREKLRAECENVRLHQEAYADVRKERDGWWAPVVACAEEARDAARLRAETAEGWVERLTKWGEGAANLIISELDIDGEEEMSTRALLSQARAFLAGRGGSPTERGTEPSTGGEKP